MMSQKYSVVKHPQHPANRNFKKIINVLKNLLDKKIREVLGLRETVEFSKINNELIDSKNRALEDQLRESENERRSLLRLIDLSNNLIANYENLIVNYRTNLESSKKELETLKKQLEECEKLKQSEIDALTFRCNKELKEKKSYLRKLRKMMTFNVHKEEQIQFYENYIVNIESQRKM